MTFTILLVSGNTMAMSVRERIKEVGVLKTLGFTNDTILTIIIGETLTIAVIGGVIGLMLATILDMLVGMGAQAVMTQLHGLSVTPVVAAISLGLALLIGLISSFLPPWNAARRIFSILYGTAASTGLWQFHFLTICVIWWSAKRPR